MKVCKKCGSTDIYRSGQCRPCKIIYSATYRDKTPEKVKQQRAVHYQKHKDKLHIIHKKYQMENYDKLKIKMSEYRDTHRERLRLAAAEYRLKNSDKIKQYRQANRVMLNKRSEEYRKNNLDVFRRLSHNRRARVANVGGKLSSDIENKLIVLQKGRCPCCGDNLGEDYHLDHIMPIALGGSNTDDNVQLLKARCNLQKNKKHPIDFMQQRGFLL